ncbi:cupin domain-containing protein [Paraburkholderia sp.]|uniref:cupin domain-containing protein n=1 Tax=Paraburkholderia sp. TaxID=1926495 RepID=UPI003D6F6D02
MQRPDFIKHWTELEKPDADGYRDDPEQMGYDAPLSEALGVTRIGIHHVRLLPGRRTSYPHAESTEQEFVYVLHGTPDVWIDGVLHPLVEGDSVAFPAGTGICHTFLNNTNAEVRLMVIGERPRDDNRIKYPLNQARELKRTDGWTDWPARPIGGHNGMPDRGSNE